MKRSTPHPSDLEASTSLQAEDVLPHPRTASSDNVRIEICGKMYDFSKEMVEKYPKLLDPATRYTINMDAIIPLVYEYPVSCIPQQLLDEDSEKIIFLSNCEWFNLKLSDDVILHLNQKVRKDIEECHQFIRAQTGKKGQKKLRFSSSGDSHEIPRWCTVLYEQDKEVYDSAIKPTEILNYLEIGGSLLDILTIHDFKGKNVVTNFIRLFKEKFLSRAS